MYLVLTGFILVVAVLIEQFFRNRRFEMLYYKNDHRFSIVVAVRYYRDSLERLFEHAKKSKHQWIFVNINGAIDPETYPDLNVKSLWIDDDPRSYEKRIEILSKAYSFGCSEMTEPFLLYMDAMTCIRKFKTLDFMANNLVEHQLFTVKPTRLRKLITDGHTLPFDLFNDMNTDRNDINFNFFAIKRDTYNLAGCNVKEYTKISEFYDDIFKKNISITHINHAESIEQVIEFDNYKDNLHFYINSIIRAERLKALSIMPLLMIALHTFYVLFVIEFGIFAILLYLLAHIGIFVVYKPFLQHHLLSYFLMPFYILYFDVLFTFAMIKRVLYLRNPKHPSSKIKEYEITQETDEPTKKEAGVNE